MISDEIRRNIIAALGFAPTHDQARAIDTVCQWLTDRDTRVAMILSGAAGSGKTSLAGAIVRAMLAMKQRLLLLAPTGRAAKVFSVNAGHPAYTIHRKIYRQKALNAEMSGFNLNDNLHTDTLFLVDEASMVANYGGGEAQFGSGCLLDDLISYVYSGRNCRLMLIGDAAQLPPVGEEESPALSKSTIEGYGLKVYAARLSEVLRQSLDSGILYNATIIRSVSEERGASLSEERGVRSEELNASSVKGNNSSLLTPHSSLKIRFKGFSDIKNMPGDELIEQLASSYSEVGIDETIVVTRSNKRANIYNNGIRNRVLDRESELEQGDMLMVVKNNYHWKPKSLSDGNNSSLPTSRSSMDFIANGDRARVEHVGNEIELYGFRFADVRLSFPDYDDCEIETTVILDSLNAEAPSLTREQNERLFNAVMEDYADIPLKADRLKALKADKYFNALQVKYAYATTCHKAQGGQWAHVYIDQGYLTTDMINADYYHWLYTAFTRATEKLYLVNWKSEE